jgi:hypothetical protein
VLATAVAKGEEYGKIIDESNVDFSESRAKELNGLLETTLMGAHGGGIGLFRPSGVTAKVTGSHGQSGMGCSKIK